MRKTMMEAAAMPVKAPYKLAYSPPMLVLVDEEEEEEEEEAEEEAEAEAEEGREEGKTERQGRLESKTTMDRWPYWVSWTM